MTYFVNENVGVNLDQIGISHDLIQVLKANLLGIRTIVPPAHRKLTTLQAYLYYFHGDPNSPEDNLRSYLNLMRLVKISCNICQQNIVYILFYLYSMTYRI